MHKTDMSQAKHRYIISPRTRKSIISVGLLLFVFIVPSLAFAAIASIDTDDDNWDSNWGNPLRVDGNAEPAGYDMDTFWVNTDAASPSVYYFGLSTHGALANDAIAYFWIDCNDNGIFTDNADRVIEYDQLNDWATEYSGDEVLQELGDDPDPNGEVIGGNQIEVQTNNAGDVSWGGCQAANHEIKAEIWDDIITNVLPGDNSHVQSGTIPRVYDIPTAVTLTTLSAKTNAMGLTLFSCIVIGSLVSMALFAIRKRQISSDYLPKD